METNDDLGVCVHWIGKSITWRRRDITTEIIEKWIGVARKRYVIKGEWAKNKCEPDDWNLQFPCWYVLIKKYKIMSSVQQQYFTVPWNFSQRVNNIPKGSFSKLVICMYIFCFIINKAESIDLFSLRGRMVGKGQEKTRCTWLLAVTSCIGFIYALFYNAFSITQII